jgi:hypothetical protein
MLCRTFACTGAMTALCRRCQPHLCEPSERRKWTMSDADDRLRELLRGEPPAGVRALDESSRAELADLVDDALRRQAASLAEAFTATLKHVPFPVRGIVKKVLSG